jgi:putative transposase
LSDPDRRHPARLSCELYRVPDEVMFVTIRARRETALTECLSAEIVRDTMGRMAAKRGVRVHAYCLMPDHLHVVLSVTQPGGDAEKWVRYFKRETAVALGTPGMWQRSYWDRHARVSEDVVAMVEYTLANPARAGLTAEWRKWPYAWSEWHETAGSDPNVS